MTHVGSAKNQATSSDPQSNPETASPLLSPLRPQVKDRLGTGPGDVTVLHGPQEPGDCEKEALFWLPQLTKQIKTLLFAWHQ